MVFDYQRAISETARIIKIEPGAGNRRRHPVYQFRNANDGYICEVRYGGPAATPSSGAYGPTPETDCPISTALPEAGSITRITIFWWNCFLTP